MDIRLSIKPELDPGFVPAVLWNRAYRKLCNASDGPVEVAIALKRPDKTCSIYKTSVLPLSGANQNLTLRYLERALKFLLWQRGGTGVFVAGCDSITSILAHIYSPKGPRQFDGEFLGEKAYRKPVKIEPCLFEELPAANERSKPLGRNVNGCRIGFDLGGSDRKCAAVIDGEVVFSEELEWNPYFERDANYHIDGVYEILRRAASHLPRVDGIGGSTAGIIVGKEVRASSLFRGVSKEEFELKIRRIFADLQERFDNVPFEVVNDGDVTALAGSMSLRVNGLLGISMGTSQAAGYVNTDGNITSWLNELAFAPVDYRKDAPKDEWSLDRGCGVQYFSQQAVARLAPAAGVCFQREMPLPERLEFIQQLMGKNDPRAKKIYSAIGTYLGYAIAHYAEFYELKAVLLLGRVISGPGGSTIIDETKNVLREEFPDLEMQLDIVTPSEKQKRHGQAIAAASLPVIGGL